MNIIEILLEQVRIAQKNVDEATTQYKSAQKTMELAAMAKDEANRLLDDARTAIKAIELKNSTASEEEALVETFLCGVTEPAATAPASPDSLKTEVVLSTRRKVNDSNRWTLGDCALKFYLKLSELKTGDTYPRKVFAPLIGSHRKVSYTLFLLSYAKLINIKFTANGSISRVSMPAYIRVKDPTESQCRLLSVRVGAETFPEGYASMTVEQLKALAMERSSTVDAKGIVDEMFAEPVSGCNQPASNISRSLRLGLRVLTETTP